MGKIPLCQWDVKESSFFFFFLSGPFTKLIPISLATSYHSSFNTKCSGAAFGNLEDRISLRLLVMSDHSFFYSRIQ